VRASRWRVFNRWLSRWGLLAIALLLIGAAAVRLVAPEGHTASLLLTGLTPWVFAVALPLAIVCGVCRRWVAFACCLVVAVAHVAWIWPEVFDTKPVPHGMELRLATANVFVGNPRRGKVADALSDTHADVVFVEELTPRLFDQMRRDGLFHLYPFQFARPEHNPQGIGVFSKYPLRDATDVPLGPAHGLHVTAIVHGHAIPLWAVHTHAPTRGAGRGLWNAEYQAFRANVARGTAPVIVAGDFNATMQFPTLQAFARRAHLTEANQARGQGLASTWPANRFFPPLLRLDHVFVRGIGVAGVHEFTVPGSDHRGIVTDLVLPAR
jgi:endonuclease/exonuclease/phosphatase (EEP) superfamily protein YafD